MQYGDLRCLSFAVLYNTTVHLIVHLPECCFFGLVFGKLSALARLRLESKMAGSPATSCPFFSPVRHASLAPKSSCSADRLARLSTSFRAAVTGSGPFFSTSCRPSTCGCLSADSQAYKLVCFLLCLMEASRHPARSCFLGPAAPIISSLRWDRSDGRQGPRAS